MTATLATQTRPSNTTRRDPSSGRGRRRSGAVSAPYRASDLPREYRITHVYRTLGRGLVAEYDPD